LALALSLLAAQRIFAAATNTPPSDDIPPLRPAHAEIPPTFWEQHGLEVMLFGALLLGLICAAVWFLFRRRPPAVIPPEVEAMQALEPLRQQPEDGVVLSRVSQILRRYVAAAFHLPPGELTTTDFSRAIAGQGEVGPELSAALTEFLRQCDQRKFSPPVPAPPLSAAAQALKLIEQAQARRAALAQPVSPRDGSLGANLPKPAAEK
jgi:hypothetical protein